MGLRVCGVHTTDHEVCTNRFRGLVVASLGIVVEILRGEKSCRHCQASIEDSRYNGGSQRDNRDLTSSSTHAPLAKMACVTEPVVPSEVAKALGRPVPTRS